MAADAVAGDRPAALMLCIISLVSLGALSGCQPGGTGSPSLWKLSGQTMGTTYSVSIVSGAEAAPSQVRAQIDQRLAEVNRLMSTYDPASELSRFNQSESTDWFAVSAETASVVQAALQLAAGSGGAFDPTVGPLVNLWGFGPGKRRRAPPTEDEIATASEAVGYQLVEVRADPPALRKSNRAVYLDLSSIAKGHGVDAVAELLAESGASAFMVEIGGEIRTSGVKPGKLPWRIGVQSAHAAGLPVAPNQPLQQVVSLTGGSLATSGDYRNFFEHEGVRYSHTIDPKTGRPVDHDLATVTVLADSCREADGLATALLVLGPSTGYDWAVERGVAAMFVSRDASDNLVERTTPRWRELTSEPNEPGSAP